MDFEELKKVVKNSVVEVTHFQSYQCSSISFEYEDTAVEFDALLYAADLLQQGKMTFNEYTNILAEALHEKEADY
jgi:hypothetical protein